jgi:hypothetical protein
MRIGYARVSTDIGARRLFGLAADPAVAIRINVVPEPMFSVLFSNNVVLRGLLFSINVV